MDITAITNMLNLFEMKNPQRVFMRVLSAGRKNIEKVNEKAKKKK